MIRVFLGICHSVLTGLRGCIQNPSNTSTSSEARDLVHLQVLLKSLMLQSMYDSMKVDFKLQEHQDPV